MSYEGYEQYLCKKGHYWTLDAQETIWCDCKQKCPICGEEEVWSNMVNVTNGSFDDESGERIDGYKKLELIEKHSSACNDCGKENLCVCSIYKIPEDDEEDICECGHNTNDHSYNPDVSNNNLECDICECKNFKNEK